MCGQDFVVSQHPGQSPASLALYSGSVHQELAPLARSQEANNLRVPEQLQGCSRPHAVYTCGRYGNVYTALARRLSRCTQRRGPGSAGPASPIPVRVARLCRWRWSPSHE